MNKLLLTLAGSAVALAGLSAAPANARTYSSMIKCSGWRNGECVAWNRLTRGQAAQIRTGFVFPNDYTYTAYSALPHTIVTQYKLSPDERYVYTDGYVYVVDPHTYAVTRVITAPGP